MERSPVSANRPWAEIVGYSRAVRAGNLVEVSGTAAATDDGTIVAPGDVYGQAREALHIIREALEEAGRAHGEVFGSIRPATAFIEVSGFLDPEILVEIEATAVVAETPAPEGTRVGT